MSEGDGGKIRTHIQNRLVLDAADKAYEASKPPAKEWPRWVHWITDAIGVVGFIAFYIAVIAAAVLAGSLL